jgi:hypothetical protein
MSDLWRELWNKQQALYDYLQALNGQLSPDDRPNYAGDIGNAEYEIDRLGAVMDQLAADQSIPIPTDEQIKALETSVGELQTVVANGENADKLVAAATAVIATWPLSSTG